MCLFPTDHLNGNTITLLNLYFLYKIYMRGVMKTLRNKLNDLDVVWSFEHIKYPDIHVLNAQVGIFHPVDQFHDDRAIQFARRNDLIVSCSHDILDKLKDCGVPGYFVNHGLSRHFVNISA